jgi:hypothetical protein
MIYFLFWLILSFLFASAGSSRQIGYFRALLACLLLSPLIGLIIILLSEKNINRLNQIKIMYEAKAISAEDYERMVREILPNEEDKKDLRTGWIFFIVIILILYFVFK